MAVYSMEELRRNTGVPLPVSRSNELCSSSRGSSSCAYGRWDRSIVSGTPRASEGRFATVTSVHVVSSALGERRAPSAAFVSVWVARV